MILKTESSIEFQPTSRLSRWCSFVIVWCFHVLLFVLPFAFTWFNDELFEFNKMVLVYFFAVIIFGTWCLQMILEKQLLFRRTPLDIPIVLFVASQIISTIFSINPHTSLFGYYSRFHGGLLSTFAYVLLFYAAVQNLKDHHRRSLFQVFFGAAFIVSLLAIPEHFSYIFTCALITTTQQWGASHQWSVFAFSNLGKNYVTNCWVQDVVSRVFATFGQPNWLAAYAITLLPLGVVLSFFTWKRCLPAILQSVFFAVTSLLLLVTLIFTGSRSGFLGLVIGGVFFFSVIILWLIRKKTTQNRNILIFLSGVVIVAAGVCIFLGTPFTPPLNAVLHHQAIPATPAASPTENQLDLGGTDSGIIRRIVWTGALRVWQRYPFFGSGVETFAYSYYLDRPVEHNLVSEWDFLYNKAHNEFLNFLATTGTVGLLSYVVLLTSFIFLPLYWWWKKTPNELWLPALSAGLVALSVSNALGFSTVAVSVLLFLFPAVVLLKKTPSVHSQQLPVLPSELSTPQYLGLAISGVIFCGLIVSVLLMWVADYQFSQGKTAVQGGDLENGIASLLRATQIAPREPVYYEQLALADAQAATSLAESGQATPAAELGQLALTNTRQMLTLNEVNPVFYKSAARVYLYLAQIDPSFLNQTQAALQIATKLAPTDPKAFYNLALVEFDLQEKAQAFRDLQKSVELKPNYDTARLTLGQEYEAAGNATAAAEQYHYILQYLQPKNAEAQAGLMRISTMSASQKK